jgi:hypothetical protein
MATDLFPESYRAELARTAEALRSGASEQSDQSQQFLYDEVMQRIGASDRWVGLADYVDTWTEHDRFWIGIRGPMYISEAFAAEYGTDDYPPDPVFRGLDDNPQQALPHYQAVTTPKLIGASISSYSEPDLYESMQQSDYGDVVSTDDLD